MLGLGYDPFKRTGLFSLLYILQEVWLYVHHKADLSWP